MAEDDWDLYAVVRSCCTITSAANRKSHEICENFESPFDCLAALTFGDEEDQNSFAFPNLAQPRNHSSLQELQDSYKPFLPGYTTTSGYDHGVIFSGQNQPQVAQQQQQNQPTPGPPPPPPPPLALPLPSSNVVISPLVQQQQNQRRQLHQQGSTSTGTSLLPLKTTQSQTPRSRKKKSNQKRLILHVTAENLSNDVWAWRKYGQKPIKGSPYPRNYYRCSSSKGCAARKQVERSNTDPDMFIVSYTGDHKHPRPTHRNSLAGSTRNKAQQPPQKPKGSDAAAISAEKAALCSSPLSATSLSPRTPVLAHEAVRNDQEITVKAEKRNDDLIGGLLDAEDGHGHGLMGMISDDDDCDNDNIGNFDQDDDDDVLIPNMALNEDLIKGFQELVSSGGDGGGGLISQSPAFGDNLPSSVVGNGSSANAAAGGGC